jgi:integrase
LTQPGRWPDGDNLYLLVKDTKAKSWVFMWKVRGKRREMGLGGWPKVSLAQARKLRDRYRELLMAGKDPILERKIADGMPTFGECADEYVNAMSPQWRNDKHRAQWKMTLNKYAAPIRAMPVNKVETQDVLRCLKDIWNKVPETASRTRQRIEAVLDAARAHGYRTGENPARWNGHLELIMSRPAKLRRGHHAAMPYPDVPMFIKQFRARNDVSALALEFLILTATRTSETLNATWDEIDFTAKVWTIPAERMKAGLSAIALSKFLPRSRRRK